MPPPYIFWKKTKYKSFNFIPVAFAHEICLYSSTHKFPYARNITPRCLHSGSASSGTCNRICKYISSAFIGVADRGPVDKAVLVTSFLQYTSKFGTFRKDSLLTYSVLKFFENGGRNCYIVRTMPTVSTPLPPGVTPPSTASLKVKNTFQLDITTPQDSMQIFAGAYWTDNNGTSQNGEPGRWGNDLTVTIEDGSTNSENEFKVSIKKNDETLESFDDLSILKDTSNYFESVINNASLYISVKDLYKPKDQWPSTGFLKSGKSPGTNLSALDAPKKLSISIDNLAPVTIDLSPPEDVADGTKIAAAITKKVKGSLAGQWLSRILVVYLLIISIF